MLSNLKAFLNNSGRKAPARILAMLLCVLMLLPMMTPIASALDIGGVVGGQATGDSTYYPELVDELAKLTGDTASANAMLDTLKQKGIIDARGMPVLAATFNVDGVVMNELQLRAASMLHTADEAVTLDGSAVTWGDVQDLIAYVDNYKAISDCLNSGETLTEAHIANLRSLAEYLASGNATLEGPTDEITAAKRTEIMLDATSSADPDAFKSANAPCLFPVGSANTYIYDKLNGLDENSLEYRIKKYLYTYFGHYFDVDKFYSDMVSKGLVDEDADTTDTSKVFPFESANFYGELADYFNYNFAVNDVKDFARAFSDNTLKPGYYFYRFFTNYLDIALLGTPSAQNIRSCASDAENFKYSWSAYFSDTLLGTESDKNPGFYVASDAELAGRFFTYYDSKTKEPVLGLAHTNFLGEKLPGADIAWSKDLVLYSYDPTYKYVIKDDGSTSAGYYNFDKADVPINSWTPQEQVDNTDSIIHGLRFSAEKNRSTSGFGSVNSCVTGHQIYIGALLTRVVEACDNEFITNWYNSVTTLAEASELWYFIRSLSKLNTMLASDPKYYTSKLYQYLSYALLAGVYGSMEDFMKECPYVFPESKYGFKYNPELLLRTNSDYSVDITEILDFLYEQGLMTVTEGADGYAELHFVPQTDLLGYDDTIIINNAKVLVGWDRDLQCGLQFRGQFTNPVIGNIEEALNNGTVRTASLEIPAVAEYLNLSERIGELLDTATYEYTDVLINKTTMNLGYYIERFYGITREEIMDPSSEVYKHFASSLYYGFSFRDTITADNLPNRVVASLYGNGLYNKLDTNDKEAVAAEPKYMYEGLKNYHLTINFSDEEKEKIAADLNNVISSLYSAKTLTVNGKEYNYQEFFAAMRSTANSLDGSMSYSQFIAMVDNITSNASTGSAIHPELKNTMFRYLFSRDNSIVNFASELSPVMSLTKKENQTENTDQLGKYVTIDLSEIKQIDTTDGKDVVYPVIKLMGLPLTGGLPMDISFNLTLSINGFNATKKITIPAGEREVPEATCQSLWQEYMTWASSDNRGPHLLAIATYTLNDCNNSAFRFSHNRWATPSGYEADAEQAEQVRTTWMYRIMNSSFKDEVSIGYDAPTTIEKIVIPSGNFYPGDIIPVTLYFPATIVPSVLESSIAADGTFDCGITVDFNNGQTNVKPTIQLNPTIEYLSNYGGKNSISYSSRSHTLTFPYVVQPNNTGTAGITSVNVSATTKFEYWIGGNNQNMTADKVGNCANQISEQTNINCKIITPDKMDSFSDMSLTLVDEAKGRYLVRLVFKPSDFVDENNAYYAWAASDASPDQTLDKNNDGTPDAGFYLRSFYATVKGAGNTRYPFFVEYSGADEKPIAIYSYIDIPTLNTEENAKKYTIIIHSSTKFNETDDYIFVKKDNELAPLTRLTPAWRAIRNVYLDAFDKNGLFSNETADVAIAPCASWTSTIANVTAGESFYVNQFIEKGDEFTFTYTFGDREGSFYDYTMTAPEQFEWVSSNTKVANVKTTLETYRFGTKDYQVLKATVSFTGVSGNVFFTLKVKNGGFDEYAYSLKTETLNVSVGYLPYLTFVGRTAYGVQGNDLELSFITNLIEKNNANGVLSTDFSFNLYASDAAGVKTGESLYTATLSASMSNIFSAVSVPKDKMVNVSELNGYSYVAEISAVNKSKEGTPDEVLSSSTKIVVKEAPVIPKMLQLPSYFLLDDKDVTLSFKLDYYKPQNANAQAKYMLTKNGEPVEAYSGDVKSLTPIDGVYSINIPASVLTVPDNALKDVYVIQIYATNNTEVAGYSTDSYLFYVYNHTALDLLVTQACKGATIIKDDNGTVTKIVFDNREYLKPYIKVNPGNNLQYLDLGNGVNQVSIPQLREDLNLSAYLSLNYSQYVWGMLSDQIAWAVNGDSGYEYVQVGLQDSYSASRVYYLKQADGSFTEAEVIRDNYKAMRDDAAAGGLYTVYAKDVTVNYKQGGYYSDIESYTYLSYLPASKMLLQSISSSGEKELSITATHVNTGMQQTIDLSSRTLRDKLYLFQSNLDTVVTFSFKLSSGAKTTINSDEHGQLALYLPDNAIESNITLKADVDGVEYTGTIVKESLLSCEQSVALLQIYPLNRANLRKLSEVTVFVKDDKGAPIANKEFILRGGVFKNASGGGSDLNYGYCQSADLLIGEGVKEDTKYGDNSNGRYDQKVTTDALGRVVIRFNSTQFAIGQEGNDLFGSTITYRFEFTDPSKTYLPSLTSITISPDKTSMATGNGEITLRPYVGSGVIGTFERHFYAGLGDSGNTTTLDINLLSRSVSQIGLSNKIKHASMITNTVVLGAGGTLGRQSNFRSNESEYEKYQGDAMVSKGDFMILDPAVDPTANYAYYYNSKGERVAGQYSRIECYYFSSVSFLSSSWDIGESVFDGWLLDEESDTLNYKIFIGGMEYYSEEQKYTVRNQYNIVDVADKDKGFEDQAANLADEIRDSLDMDALFSKLVPGGDMLAKGLTFFSGIASGGDYTVNMMVAPTSDPCVFNIVVSVGDEPVGEEKADGFGIDYSATEEIAKMAEQMSGDDEEEDGESPIVFKFFGSMNAQAIYNDVTKSWDLQLTGGTVGAKVGVEKEYSKNFVVGIVPCTVSFTAEAGFSFSVGGNSSGDMLIGIGANAGISVFAGIGFDIGIAAVKLGIEGSLGADMDFSTLTKFDGTIRTGSQMTIKASIGLKFVAKALFITYTHTFASASFEWTKQWGNYTESLPNGTTIEGKNYTAEAFGDGMILYSIDEGTGVSYEYLSDGTRLWNISANPTDEKAVALQTNAYPFSNPVYTDDGLMAIFISDIGSAKEEDATVVYSMVNPVTRAHADEVAVSRKDTDKAEDYGYGDTDAVASGSGGKYFAAWIKQTSKINFTDPSQPTGAEVLASMNGSEIYASVYDNSKGEWVTTRLTNNDHPDFAVQIISNGDHAVAVWRSVAGGVASDPLNFAAQDNVVYSVYDPATGTWSEAKLLYNGTLGAANQMEVAMAANGAVLVAMDVQTDSEAETVEGYELVYSCIGADGKASYPVRVTGDQISDTNVRVTSFTEGGKEKFLLAWYRGEETPIVRTLAVADDGKLDPAFTEQLSGGAVIGNDFRLNAAPGAALTDVVVSWIQYETITDTVDLEKSYTRNQLNTAKLYSYDGVCGVSAAVATATVDKNVLIDEYSLSVSGNTVNAILQVSDYSTGEYEVSGTVEQYKFDENGNVVTDGAGNPVTEQRQILTAVAENKLMLSKAEFKNSAFVTVDKVDGNEIMQGTSVSLSFHVRNEGYLPITSIDLTFAGKAPQNINRVVLPGEDATISVFYTIPFTGVSDVAYTVKSNFSNGNNDTDNGIILLDRPGIAVTSINTISAKDGKRVVSVALANNTEIPLAGTDKVVKVALYADADMTQPLAVSIPADRLNSSLELNGNVICTKGDYLAMIDAGVYGAYAEFDIKALMALQYTADELSSAGGEIPKGGVTVYAKAWIESAAGVTLEEDNGLDNTKFQTYYSLIHDDKIIGLTTNFVKQTEGEGISYVVDLCYNNQSLNDQTVAAFKTLVKDKDGKVIYTWNTFKKGDEFLQLTPEAGSMLSKTITAAEMNNELPATIEVVCFTGEQTVSFDVGTKYKGTAESSVIKVKATFGETVAAASIPAPTCAGYRFDGWYTTEACADADKADFTTIMIDGPLTVYAKWTLLPPEVKTQPAAVNAAFDGSDHNMTVTPETHTETISYQWYRLNGEIDSVANGETDDVKLTAATSAALPLRVVGDSGSYYCVLSVTAGGKTEQTVSTAAAAVISKRTLTVTANDNSIIYGNDPAANGVTFDGFIAGEDVSVLSGTLAYDYSYTKFGNVGNNYKITPKGYTSNNYAFNYVDGTLTVNPKEIGITWTNTTLIYNTQPQKPTATATGLVNDDSCEITVSGEQTVVGASSYTAMAASLSNSNYCIPDDNTTQFVIERAVVKIPMAYGTYIYDGTNQTVRMKDVTELMYVTGTTASEVGSYKVTVSLYDTANYKWSNGETTPQELRWSIDKAVLTITAADVTITYGEAPKNAGVTYSAAAGDISKNISGNIAYTYSYTQYGDVGTYTITPSGLTSDTYEIIYVTGTLSVEPKEIGVDWTNTAFSYNGKVQKPTASATGLLNGDKCEITVTGEMKDAGSYTATAASLDNANYKLPAQVTQAFTISKISLNITAKDNKITFGAAPANAGVSFTGFVSGETEKVLAGTLAYDYNYKQYDKVGSYSITPKGLTSANYDITFTAGKLAVDVREISIAVDSLSSIEGETLKELTYKITSGEFCNKDAEAIRLTKAEGSTAGEYAITGAYSDANYKVTFTNGVYTILKKTVDDGNNSTGIQITSENGLDPDTKLVVVIEDKENYKDVDLSEAVGGNRKLGRVFEITLESSGVKVQPNGKISIRLPIPDDMKDDKNLSVVYIDANKKATDVNATRDGDFMVFEVDHLSVYAIVGTGNLAKTLTITAIAVAVVLAAGGFCVYWFVIRKKKEEKNR